MNDAAAEFAAIGMLKHLSYGGLRNKERGAHIQRDHIVQMGFGNLQERLGNIHSRVVQEDVQALKTCERRIHLLRLGDVANDDARVPSGSGNVFCHLLEFAPRSADQNDFRSGLGKRDGRFRAKPAARSGDERKAAINSKSRGECWAFACGFGRGISMSYRASPEVVRTLTLRLP